MEASLPASSHERLAGLPVRLGLLGDERLARLVSDGSERAFVAVFERYHQPLYRYCRSILRHDSDAQDALQSAFARALVALRRGQRDAPLRPWLFRIAHNEAISLIRRRGTAEELSDGVEPWVASAEQHAGERERLALLVADLQELPERQRAALVMRELSGLSHEEIALALDASVGTAKQAIFEARSALLEFAEGRAMACDEICRRISDGDRRALRGRKVRAHLRDCASCAAFAAAIPARTADLHAMALPLVPLAAAGLLGQLTGRASAYATAGGGGAAGAGGAAGTVVGKIAGAGLASKVLVAATVVGGAAAGVTGALSQSHHAQPRPRAHAPARTGITPVDHRVVHGGHVNARLQAVGGGGAGQRVTLGEPASGSVGHAHGRAAIPPRLGDKSGGARASAPGQSRPGGEPGRSASHGGQGRSQAGGSTQARGDRAGSRNARHSAAGSAGGSIARRHRSAQKARDRPKPAGGASGNGQRTGASGGTSSVAQPGSTSRSRSGQLRTGSDVAGSVTQSGTTRTSGGPQIAAGPDTAGSSVTTTPPAQTIGTGTGNRS